MFLSQAILMYLFSFKQFAWHDRVFQTNLPVWNAGDLIQCGWDFLLNLGEEISFSELIRHQFSPTSPYKVVYPWFFDQKYLSLAHWMVYEWYSTYNNVLKYFISYEISQLLSRENKIKSQSKVNISDTNLPIDNTKQNLIIIPDNRSRENQLSDFFHKDNILHLYSTDTQNRKDQNRWNIKKSKSWIIVSTQSEIFQPFNNLGTVILVDWYKRYYHNQQDPRYDVNTVIQKMAEIRSCKVLNMDNIGLIK